MDASNKVLYFFLSAAILNHLPLDKMAAFSQTIFLDAFSWMKGVLFWLKFIWSSN